MTAVVAALSSLSFSLHLLVASRQVCSPYNVAVCTSAAKIDIHDDLSYVLPENWKWICNFFFLFQVFMLVSLDFKCILGRKQWK